MADDREAPALRWRDLVDYTRAQSAVPRSGAAENATVAWGVVSRFVGRPEHAHLSPDRIVTDLSEQRWRLEYNLTPSQKLALGDAVAQLRQVVDEPVRLHDFNRRQQQRAQTGPAGQQRSAGGRSGPAPDAALAATVSRSAAGSVVVYTSSRAGVPVRSASGASLTEIDGYNAFGDGEDGKRDLRAVVGRLESAAGMTEGAMFRPAMEDVLATQQVVTRQRRFGMDETEAREVKVGERQLLMAGPDGRQEQAVHFTYAYDPHQAASYRDDLPTYHDPATGRPGNVLIVDAVLPQSVADNLRTAIEQNPDAARAVAERLVLERGGLDREAWEGHGAYDGHSMKPPFQAVPATEPFHLITAGQDGSAVVRTLSRAPQAAAGPRDLSDFVNKHLDPSRCGRYDGSTDGARPDHTRSGRHRTQDTSRGSRS